MQESASPISDELAATRSLIEQIVAVDPELLRCSKCDYIIHGDGHDHCPECGIEIDMNDLCVHVIETNRPRLQYLWYTQVAKLPPEALCCVRCGYSLIGQMSNRCPECGLTIDWEDVAHFAASRIGDLFEYRWAAAPLKSIATTFWLGATSPFRLWRTYSRYDTPNVKPLVILILIQWLIFARGWQTTALAIDPFMNDVIAANAPGPKMQFTYNPRFENADLIDYAMWSVFTFLALSLFVQSNREYKANWRHVLRVFAHSTFLASFSTGAWCILEAALDSSLYYWPWPKNPRSGVPSIGFDYYSGLGNAVLGLALVSVWAMLWIGYKKYLRIPHGWAIAAVAIFVGHLATQCIHIITAWEY
ncbi:MAG: hypothetical protein R3E58_17950 [Phycisphaerae bacterium]